MMDSALTVVISKEKQQIIDAASRKLTGEEKLSRTTQQVNACSLKLIRELMIQAVSLIWCTLIMMESQRIYLPQD